MSFLETPMTYILGCSWLSCSSLMLFSFGGQQGGGVLFTSCVSFWILSIVTCSRSSTFPSQCPVCWGVPCRVFYLLDLTIFIPWSSIGVFKKYSSSLHKTCPRLFLKETLKNQQSKSWSNPFGFSVQLPRRKPGQSLRMQFVESLPFGHKHQPT